MICVGVEDHFGADTPSARKDSTSPVGVGSVDV